MAEIRYVNKSDKTYAGPSISYSSVGSLNAGDTVTYIPNSQAQGDFVLVEYRITGSTTKKQAWFNRNNLAISRPSYFIDPINKDLGYAFGTHKDYPVREGTEIYAMCDGRLEIAYNWDNRSGTVSKGKASYVSLGIHAKLYPNAGWKGMNGNTCNFIENGHLSSVPGYSFPKSTTNINDINISHPTLLYEGYYPSSFINGTTKTQPIATKTVKCGDVIGYSGNTGNCAGIHFHIELK